MEDNFFNQQQPPVMNITERVNQKISEGYSYDFDTFFKDGWRIFKQNFWMVAVGLCIMIIPIILISFVLTPVLGIEQNQPDIRPGAGFSEIMEAVREAQDKITVADRLKQSLLNFLYILLLAPIQAGFIGVSRKADKGEASFGDVFQYYRHSTSGRIVIAGLITTFLNVACNFAFGFLPGAGTFLALITSMVFYYLFLFVYPLIIFGNASLGEAFSLSFKLFFKKPLPIIGLTILFALIACSGIIVCCIGIVLTVAFAPICNYLLYKYSVGFPEDDREQEAQAHWQDVPPETL